MISARLRGYGKYSTKKSEDRQVELEIRNYTKKPLRISVKTDGAFTRVTLMRQQQRRAVSFL